MANSPGVPSAQPMPWFNNSNAPFRVMSALCRPGCAAAHTEAAAGKRRGTGDTVDDQRAGEGSVVVAEVHAAAGVGSVDR